MFLFDAFLATKRPEVEGLILPLAKLLCDSAVIADFSGQSYQQHLTASVCWLCQELPNVSPAIYRVRMHALELFADDPQICHNMSRLPGFSLFMVSHLSDAESSIIAVNWRFFTKYTTHPTVIQTILNSPVGPKLALIASSESPPVLKKFLEFSLALWRRQGPDVIEKFCDLLMPSLGKIAGVVRTRRSLFRGDERMLQLIEDYTRAIMALEAPGAERFIEGFAKHLESDTGLGEQKGFVARLRWGSARRPSNIIERQLA
jgi:hypothetical protein